MGGVEHSCAVKSLNSRLENVDERGRVAQVLGQNSNQNVRTTRALKSTNLVQRGCINVSLDGCGGGGTTRQYPLVREKPRAGSG